MPPFTSADLTFPVKVLASAPPNASGVFTVRVAAQGGCERGPVANLTDPSRTARPGAGRTRGLRRGRRDAGVDNRRRGNRAGAEPRTPVGVPDQPAPRGTARAAGPHGRAARRYLVSRNIAFLPDLLAFVRDEGVDVERIESRALLPVVDRFWTASAGRRWCDLLRRCLVSSVRSMTCVGARCSTT